MNAICAALEGKVGLEKHAVERPDSMRFLSMPIVAVRVVVAIARLRITLLVAMFVGVISIMASITAIAACHSYSSHYY